MWYGHGLNGGLKDPFLVFTAFDYLIRFKFRSGARLLVSERGREGGRLGERCCEVRRVLTEIRRLTIAVIYDFLVSKVKRKKNK